MAQAEDLTQLHIADLHAKAAEAGVNGYRMLGRDELIAEIQAGGKKKRSRWPRRKAPQVDPRDEDRRAEDPRRRRQDKGERRRRLHSGRGSRRAEAPARRRGRRGGRGRGGGRGRERLRADARDERGPPPRMRRPRRSPARWRSPASATASCRSKAPTTTFTSPSQVRRCEMKEGDEVTGPVRAPRRGERHRALVRVNLVNGQPPVDAPDPRRRTAAEARPRPTASIRSHPSRPQAASSFPPAQAPSFARRTSSPHWRPASAYWSRPRPAPGGPRSCGSWLRHSGQSKASS